MPPSEPHGASELERAREATLRKLGAVADRVLSRLTPLVRTDRGAVACLWPSHAIGKLKLVRRDKTVILVTDGLSDPWDRSLHPDAPSWTFGFEVAVEAPIAMLDDATDEGVAGSWMPLLLWAATDWVVLERVDLKGRLARHGCATHAVPPFGGLDDLVAANGFAGALLGIPYGGTALGAEAVLAPEPGRPDDPIWLLPLKLLTADEYEWAMGVPDASRAKQLAEAFLVRERHLSWPARASILPGLTTR